MTHQRAHRFQVHFCGHCPNAHLVFFDAKNTIICEATMTAQQARMIEEDIRKNGPNFREEKV